MAMSLLDSYCEQARARSRPADSRGYLAGPNACNSNLRSGILYGGRLKEFLELMANEALTSKFFRKIGS